MLAWCRTGLDPRRPYRTRTKSKSNTESKSKTDSKTDSETESDTETETETETDTGIRTPDLRILESRHPTSESCNPGSATMKRAGANAYCFSGL